VAVSPPHFHLAPLGNPISHAGDRHAAEAVTHEHGLCGACDVRVALLTINGAVPVTGVGE
jgi:hypothetical protein